jgi:hypothetical protein
MSDLFLNRLDMNVEFSTTCACPPQLVWVVFERKHERHVVSQPYGHLVAGRWAKL